MAQIGPARASVRASTHPSPAAFVLRIGVIRDARLVLERTFPLNAPIHIGGPHADLPVEGIRPRRLFDLLHGELVVDASVRPRTRARRGELDATLAPGDRGRIDLAGAVVLYQVVPAPPLARTGAVHIPTELDLSPRWFDEDELPFFQSLALWSALGVLLGVFVATSPAPRSVSIDELPPYLASMPEPVYLPVETPEPPAPTDDDAVAVVEVVRPPRPDVPPEPLDIDDVAPPTPGEEAVARQTARSRLEDRFRKAGLISTTGDTAWAVDPSDALAMDHLTAREPIDLDDLEGLRGPGGPDGTGGGPLGTDIDLDDFDIFHDGGSGIGEGPDIAVPTSQATGIIEPEITDPNRADWIRTGVRRFRGQVQYCYERALKVDPELEGRIELGVDVENGRVVDTWVESDSLANGVAACIESKVTHWTFGPGNTASFTWPYVFRPGR